MGRILVLAGMALASVGGWLWMKESEKSPVEISPKKEETPIKKEPSVDPALSVINTGA